MKVHSTSKQETFMIDQSNITVEAERRALVYLAAESLHRRLVAARIAVSPTDGILNRTVLKLAAEGIAGRIVGKQLPFWITPDMLTDGLVKLSVPADALTDVVAAVAASNAIKAAPELPGDDYCASILTSHLVANPWLGGRLKRIVPTSEATPVRPEPVAATNVPTHENPVADDALPHIVRPVDSDEATS